MKKVFLSSVKFISNVFWVAMLFAALAQAQPDSTRIARFPEGRAVQRDQGVAAAREQGASAAKRELPLRLSATSADRFYVKDDKIAGRTISDYAGDYLHYLFSQSHQPAPQDFAAQEGRGIEYQHGPVWFLTLAGAPDTVTRELIAPRNTPLFVSFGWGWYWLEEQEPDSNIALYQAQAEGIYDYFYDFQISLDFEIQPSSAVIATQSPVTYWPLLAEDAEVFGYESCSRVFSRAGMAGNFALLKPLAAGTHTLKIQFYDREGNYYLREFTIKVD